MVILGGFPICFVGVHIDSLYHFFMIYTQASLLLKKSLEWTSIKKEPHGVNHVFCDIQMFSESVHIIYTKHLNHSPLQSYLPTHSHSTGRVISAEGIASKLE